jgi:hypothetical protein
MDDAPAERDSSAKHDDEATCQAKPVAQWAFERPMLDALARVEQNARITGEGFAKKEFSLLGAMLSKKDSAVSITMRLEAGTKYTFLAGGSAAAVDVDIIVRDSDGDEVAHDTLTDNYPLVSFSPTQTGQFRVQVVLAKVRSAGAFVMLATLTDKGWRVPSATFAQVFRDAVTSARLVSANAQKGGGRPLGPLPPGRWTFMGGVFEKGDSHDFSGLSLQKETTLLARGDTSAIDIDLVVRTSGGVVAAQDIETDPMPLVRLTPTAGNTYAITFRNDDSSGPSLMNAMMLERK